MHQSTRLLVLGLLVLSARAADLQLPGIFSDGMVLQQGLPVAVWGTAPAGENVAVHFAGQAQTATADAQGAWLLHLSPLPASSEPREFRVRTDSKTVALTNVLVGEVWLGSGQSNMSQPVKGYVDHGDRLLEKWAQAGPYPRLRLLTSPSRVGWQTATPATIAGFSAQLFALGVNLQRELQVPVGLIVGAVSGTPSRHWLSKDMFLADAACTSALARAIADFDPAAVEKKYQADLARWEKAAAVAKGNGKTEPRKPGKRQHPEQEFKSVGTLYQRHIQPLVPFGIRGVLWDQGEAGTALTGVDQRTLMHALIKGWRQAWALPPPIDAGAPGGDFPFLYVQKPSGGGCAWPNAEGAYPKGNAVATLPSAPPDTASGLDREMHARIRENPNTAMVTSSDLIGGIHPALKSAYGLRSTAVALGFVYGRDVAFYGPIYRSHTVAGRNVRIRFSHVGRGLANPPGTKLQGFALAGADGVFHWAQADIDADAILVHSEAVAQPAAVRYAWGPSHAWATLFNRDGLPALPFRTDGPEPSR